MKHVFITGVSRGLGYGLAVHFLKNQYHVFGISRNPPDGDSHAVLDNPAFHFHPLDLSDLSNLEENFSRILDSWKNGHDFANPEFVVLNAGILGGLGDLRNTSLEEIQRIMDVNVWANKIMLDVLFAESFPMNGQVIAISSGVSVSGTRGWAGYGLSKATLNMIIKLYAAEKPEVHFTALAPGLIDTAMQDYLCGYPDTEKFPAAIRLRAARGTADMPHPVEAGEKIAIRFRDLLRYKSGSYVDIREMKSLCVDNML